MSCWEAAIDLVELVLDGVDFHDVFGFLMQITADYAADVTQRRHLTMRNHQLFGHFSLRLNLLVSCQLEALLLHKFDAFAHDHPLPHHLSKAKLRIINLICAFLSV